MLKNDGIITNSQYKELYSSGSSFGVLYGLSKAHKLSNPLRPILSTYNSVMFPIAKSLVSLLKSLTCNEFSLKNSYEFTDEIRSQNLNNYLVSYDITSLFTIVPLAETIDIILEALFPTDTRWWTTYSSITSTCSRNFLGIYSDALLSAHAVRTEKSNPA